MKYGISALVSQMSFHRETSGGIKKYLLAVFSGYWCSSGKNNLPPHHPPPPPPQQNNGNMVDLPGHTTLVVQAPVVQKVDSAIYQINLYPVDSGFPK